MTTHFAVPSLALAGLLALTPVALAGEGKSQVESPLLRPEDAPDPDAEGRVRWETWEADGRTRLRIQIKHVDSLLAHEAFLEDGTGTLVSLGLLEADDDDLDEMKLDLDSKKGEPLPFGALTIDELIGRDVEVRAASALPEMQTILEGGVPPFVEKGPAQKAKATFGAPVGSPSPDASGKIQLHRKPGKGDERFRIHAKGLPLDLADFELHLEATSGAGDFELVGALFEKSDLKGEFERRTKKGQALPFGASLADLVGRAFEIRDADGVAHLAGSVPALE